MTVYNGNSKIGNIYYGNQKIKEVYCGSTKVYSSGLPVRRYVYRSGSYDFHAYLVGSISSQSVVCCPLGNASSGDFLVFDINAISGTLGTSGSSITFSDFQGFTYNFNYKETISIDGTTIYVYGTSSGGIYDADVYVYPGSVVGSQALSSFGHPQITAVSESSLSFQYQSGSSYTATRDNSYLKTWTKDGLE